MQTESLSGKEAAASLREDVRKEAEALRARGIEPKMVAVLVGSDESVASYVEVKRRVALRLGIACEVLSLPADTNEAALIGELKRLSEDALVHGIILELPLPSGIDADRALQAILPHKDIDGLTPINLGLALANREEEAILSATAQAMLYLAEKKGALKGKQVAMIGKGRTVGRPLIPLLINRGATVVVCNRSTPDLAAAIRDSEIIFSGTGSAGILHENNVREGQTIIDAGTAYVDGELKGDVSKSAWGIAAAISPVPDGVGPLTTTFIFKNLLRAIALQNK